MEVYFLAGVRARGADVSFPAAESRHISRVCRHRAGDRVFATDGAGCELELELVDVGPESVRARVVGRRLRPREPRARVALALAIIRPDRFSGVVEAATQLGVAKVIPVRTERTEARLSDLRLERLRRVAVEAMKCSTRTVVPDISEPLSLDDLLEQAAGYERVLLAYEGENGQGLGDVLDPTIGSVLLVVGPEGGFAPGEVERLRAAGACSFSMGPRRLRAEVAAAAAVANAMQLLNEMDGARTADKPERRCY